MLTMIKKEVINTLYIQNREAVKPSILSNIRTASEATVIVVANKTLDFGFSDSITCTSPQFGLR